MFTISLDDLRAHTSAVNKCAWDNLLRNPGMLNRLEEEIENVMTAADCSCSVMLVPQSKAGTLSVHYRWSGESDANDNMTEFLKLALIDCLLEDAGIAM